MERIYILDRVHFGKHFAIIINAYQPAYSTCIHNIYTYGSTQRIGCQNLSVAAGRGQISGRIVQALVALTVVRKLRFDFLFLHKVYISIDNGLTAGKNVDSSCTGSVSRMV